MTRVVIFDLDDTLYNERQFVRSGFKAISSYLFKKNDVHQHNIYSLLLDVSEKYGGGNTFDIALKSLVYMIKNYFLISGDISST